MTQWNLSRLRNTVRKITGNLDPTQIPDSSISSLPISPTNPPGIDDYINDFYLLDLDEHLRLLALESFYTFQTIPNVGTYSLPSNLAVGATNTVYFDVKPPVYIDGSQAQWHQNPESFYTVWPQFHTIDTAIATGNGTASYSFTLSQSPIKQGTVVIGTQNSSTPGVVNESFYDLPADGTINTVSNPAFTNPGVLYSSIGGTGTGTINYLTGAVTLTFSNTIATGVNINAHYYSYVASRPRDVLFFNQQFNLMPIPNDVYKVKVVAYQQPTVILSGGGTSTQFSNSSDVPTYNEWWQVIAYGASVKLLIEQGDHQEVSTYKQYFEEAKMLCQRRTLRQLANQRIQTRYSNENNGAALYPNYPGY